MDKPLVSIIIPTYKRADFLSRAIDSALAQTYSNIEVIIVSDNNKGDIYDVETVKCMQPYLKDSRIKYIEADKNVGGALARNKGLENAEGMYVNFLDDDDYLYPTKIESQMALAKKYRYSIAVVGCYAAIKNGSGKILYLETPDFDSSDILFSQLCKNISTTSLSLVHTETCRKSGGFIKIESSQEHLFLINVFSVNASYDFVNEVLVDINWHDGARISNNPRKPIGALKLTKYIEQYYDRFDERRVKKLRLSRFKYDIYAYMQLCQFKVAFSLYLQRISLSLLNIDTLKILFRMITIAISSDKCSMAIDDIERQLDGCCKTGGCKISVVIPTLDRPLALKRTLQSLLPSLSKGDEVIIVDQSKNPKNKSENEVCGAPREYIKYIYQAEPSSTKARNKGMLMAKNDIIVFADDDIDVYPETIRNLKELFCERHISLIAGIDDNSISSVSLLPYIAGHKSIHKWNAGHVTKSMLGRYPNCVLNRCSTEWAMGYFFAVRKQCISRPWDENLCSYAFCEDLDFSFDICKRAKAVSNMCVLDSSVRVRHLASREYRIADRRKEFMYVANRLYLSHKNGFGLIGELSIMYSNFFYLLEKIIKKREYKDTIDAIMFAIKNRKDIIKGKLNYPI